MTDATRQRSRAMDRLWTIFEPWRLVVALAGTLAVLLLTHIPQDMMPVQLHGRLIDKAEHAVAYGTITFLFLLAFRKPPGVKAMFILLLAGAAVGAFDELTQPYVNRTASTLDFAADCFGIAVVCVLYLALRRCRRERLRRSAGSFA